MCYTLIMLVSYKPRLYLETTIFNFYSYGKAMQKQQDTQALFERIDAGEYQVCTSKYAVDELENDRPERYEKMYALVRSYDMVEIPRSDQADRLADIYMARGIIPKKYPDDACQIALAAVMGLDCVVSWNMGHIVKTKAMIGTGLINKREGYAQVCLATPREILEYDTRAD
ncbi:hypothetical protein FACS1894172_10440 [Spirochaetia bacterium]|nr:hypothetical protein FACS1894164_10590 [Spirochaetia bacterium]GHU32923.1 hypothetical protein FACS1894172_10440 [Spirochaetia bacterium]